MSLQSIAYNGFSKFIVFALLESIVFSNKSSLNALEVSDSVEMVRIHSKRYISHKYTRGGNTLVVYLLDPQIETIVRKLNENELSNLEHSKILNAIHQEVEKLPPTTQNPIILTTIEVRKKFWRLIHNSFPRLAVLCYQELSPDMNIQPIARISLIG